MRALRRLRKLRGAESLSLVGVFFLSVSTTDDDDDDTDDDTDSGIMEVKVSESDARNDDM